ncbi:MAG: hypothetical protein IT365_17150 [Candidatus Hydrogenedentes bacterium]|nr:hypothetical protein [Candidatus Hydrogenedentota bacterium]
MSDHYIHIIPEEPGAVPDADKREAAALYFRSIAPRSDTISTWNKESLEFIDCGANFGRITCPSCGAEFEVDLWNDWMDSDVSKAGFTLTRRAMPCCGAGFTLHDLAYEWPQGFARFGVRAMNPNIGKLSVEQRARFESILGCRVRVVYQHM